MITKATHILFSAVPDGRVFGLDQQTLISILIQLLNACILAVVLGLILYKPVQQYMKKRTDRIGGQIKDAQSKMSDANKVKAEYEKKLQEIDTQRIKILDAAKADAAKQGKAIIEEARKQAKAIKQHAEESISGERQRLKKETKQHIIEVSALMATKFVSRSIDSETQDKLFEETISELEDAEWAG